MAFRIPTPQEIANEFNKGSFTPTAIAPKLSTAPAPTPTPTGGSYPSNFIGPVPAGSNFNLPPRPTAPSVVPTGGAAAGSGGFDAYKYPDDPTVYGPYQGNPNHAFTSAQEFLNAGGDWNRVNVVARPANINLPGGTYQVDPATGNASKSDALAGLKIDPQDVFSLEDLRAGANSPTTASAITAFLNDLMLQRDKLGAALAQTNVPTQAETDLETALTELRGAADSVRLSYQAGVNKARGEITPMEVIRGNETQLYNQANLETQTLASQESVLLGRLGIEQKKREGARSSLETQLGILDSNSETYLQATQIMQKEQEMLFSQAATLREDQQNVLGTIIDKFKGLDLNDLDANTQNYLAKIATQAGVPFGVLAQGLKVVKDQRLFENAIKEAELMGRLQDADNLAKLLSLDDIKKLNEMGIPASVGQTYGDMQGVVPGAKAQNEALERSQSLLSSINSLLTAPGFDNAVGPISSKIPAWMNPFTAGKKADFEANFNALQSMMALENLSLLKGPMSDKDIQFIKEASSGLNLNMSQDGFRKKLTEIKTKIEASIADDIINQSGFKPAGKPQASTGMRTDRHNNPTAFTTDVAKTAGLVEGKDYVVGDPFPNNPNLKTAKLLGDPIAQTIKVIDRIGFYTQSGKPRWSYVSSLSGANNWKSLSYAQKKNVIAQMYKHEGGSALKQYFA